MNKELKKTKQKLSPKEEKEMVEWISDYFCTVILPICHIKGYKVFTKIDKKGEKDKTFSIEVGFPYRSITLYIRRGGIEYYKDGNIEAIRSVLFHEAFHVMHWNYKEYAEARFIGVADLSEREENLADLFSIIVDSLYNSCTIISTTRYKQLCR